MAKQIGQDTKVVERFLNMVMRGCLYEWCREATQNEVKSIIHVVHEVLEPVILVGSMVIGPIGIAFGLLETVLYVFEGNWKAAGISLLFCIPGLKQLKCMKKFVATLKAMPFYAKVEKVIKSGEEFERFLAKLSSKTKNNPFMKDGYKELTAEIEITGEFGQQGLRDYLFIDLNSKYTIHHEARQIIPRSQFGQYNGILKRPQI